MASIKQTKIEFFQDFLIKTITSLEYASYSKKFNNNEKKYIKQCINNFRIIFKSFFKYQSIKKNNKYTNYTQKILLERIDIINQLLTDENFNIDIKILLNYNISKKNYITFRLQLNRLKIIINKYD